MSEENITIQTGTIREVVDLSLQIPEFIDPHPLEEYEKRLKNKESLVLIASYSNLPAGFKVGYNKENDGSFYSWMGAVLPPFRKLGIAKKLASYQEKWAFERGYKKVRFKTRNHLKSMLVFALQNNFNIVEVIHQPNLKDNRIILEKELISPL